jgi:hypothetical protein
MKNTKLILHRCGLFFMFLTLFLLFVRDGENTSEAYSYTFRHAASILVWGLFFGVSFVLFDIPKIPSLVSRILHFLLNGVATCLWIVAIQTQVKSNILQIIFFAIFAYVVLYWILHFINLGVNKLIKKINSLK